MNCSNDRMPVAQDTALDAELAAFRRACERAQAEVLGQWTALSETAALHAANVRRQVEVQTGHLEARAAALEVTAAEARATGGATERALRLALAEADSELAAVRRERDALHAELQETRLQQVKKAANLEAARRLLEDDALGLGALSLGTPAATPAAPSAATPAAASAATPAAPLGTPAPPWTPGGLGSTPRGAGQASPAPDTRAGPAPAEVAAEPAAAFARRVVQATREDTTGHALEVLAAALFCLEVSPARGEQRRHAPAPLRS